MGSEGTQDYLYGAGLYYQNGTNYNWYDPNTGLTGIQATPKWDDPQPMLGFEGQDLQYSTVQQDTSRCLYYSPEYGYTQSAYDPYMANSFQLGQMVGPAENSLIGTQVTQQYLTNPPQPQYHQSQQVPSPNYPSLDIGSVTTPSYQHGSLETLNYSNYMNNPAVATSATRAIMPPLQRTGTGTITVTGMPISSSSLEFQPAVKAPKTPVLGLSPLKQSVQRPAPHITQVTNPSASVKGPPSQEKSTRPGALVNQGAGLTHLEPETRNGGRVSAFWGNSTITVKSYTSRIPAGDPQGNIIIDINNYNRADFPTDYICAKFFVIKSYSEDDVHKSVKYGVWSSTPNGNKKLSSAYEEAQRISAKNGVKCPVFLFFSVNTSGHFCGVAEMVGPVEFDKNMDLWQQDKWPGSFPVKWHVIKNVANNTLRQILLENNEFKPVTHSRDTQEVPFTPGVAILKIFKSHAFINSILDQFLKFEEQERNNRRKCTKLLSSDAPLFVPTFVRKQAVSPKEPQFAPEKKQDEKSSAEEHVPVEMLPENCTVLKENSKENSIKQANPVIKAKNKPVENGKYQSKPLDQIENVAEKIGSLSIKSCEVNDENRRSSGGGDVVTIGSMHVRVNSFNEM